jgi:hypothetical protein
MSDKAAKKIRETWHLATCWSRQPLDVLARLINPAVRGWVAYYGRFYRSRCLQVLSRCLTFALVKWAMRKYKCLRGRWVRAYRWLGGVAARDRELFALWSLGARPPAER